MKKILTCAMFCLCGCVWRERLPDASCREEEVNIRSAISLFTASPPWGGEAKAKEAALKACNLWQSAGLLCNEAENPDDADLYVDYYFNASCEKTAFYGSLGENYGGRVGIWINSACVPRNDTWVLWYTHLAAHEVGHLLGVDDVPVFCGEAVMNSGIERNAAVSYLDSLTDADMNSFAERFHHSPLLGEALANDCGDEEEEETETTDEVEECAASISTDESRALIWIHPDLAPYRSEILASCEWWSPVNFSCSESESQEAAQVAFFPYPEEYGCGLAGYTYPDYERLNGRPAIEINIWCAPEDPYWASVWIENTAAHELGHIQGLEHVPFWCGEALMNPGVQEKTCISETDIAAWQERHVP